MVTFHIGSDLSFHIDSSFSAGNSKLPTGEWKNAVILATLKMTQDILWEEREAGRGQVKYL